MRGYPPPVTWVETLAVLAAGVGAGAVNAVVGSGTLITFPTLLALGVPPVTANVSNSIGLVPGLAAASWGYRRELTGQSPRLVRLAPASALGAVTGAVLLLALPEPAFAAVVPVLLGVAVVLVLVQPRLQARVHARRTPGQPVTVSRPLLAGVLGTGVYGGYFGAAQGVLLIGLLGSALPEPLQRVNAVKNVLALLVNAVAAATFLVVAPGRIDGALVVLVAAGSVVGGVLGARFGRRLPDHVLRGLVVTIGTVAIWRVVAT